MMDGAIGKGCPPNPLPIRVEAEEDISYLCALRSLRLSGCHVLPSDAELSSSQDKRWCFRIRHPVAESRAENGRQGRVASSVGHCTWASMDTGILLGHDPMPLT